MSGSESNQYTLLLTATVVSVVQGDTGVPGNPVAFEVFDATHMAIDYRYPMALSWLARRLAR